FVCARANGAHFEWAIFEGLPFSSLNLTTACENSSVRQRRALAGVYRNTVAYNAGIDGTDEDLFGGGIANTSRYWKTILHKSNRNAKFRNALYELAGAIQGIDDPNPAV